MKTNIFIFFLIMAVIVAQTSGVPVLFSRNQIPNIILVGLIVAVIIWGFFPLLTWIILTGLLWDLASYGAIGKNVVILVLITYGVSLFSKRFLVENKGWGTLIIGFLVFLATLSFRILTFLLPGSREIKNFPAIFIGLEWEFAYNLAVFSLIFYFLRKISRSATKLTIG